MSIWWLVDLLSFDLCLRVYNLIEMVAHFIEKTIIKLGNMTVEAKWWNIINSERDVKCAGSLILNHLLTSWRSMLDFME